MTANSASGSKYYELLSTQQDYVAARSQNWLPSYSVITLTADAFSIDTYQITDDGKAEAIDDTFTIKKTGTDTTNNSSDTSDTSADHHRTVTLKHQILRIHQQIMQILLQMQ